MAGFIPDDQVARIRNSVNIVDVISEHLILKKAGKNFVGLCPFHAEKTPSFSVNPDRQYFHCYGCGAGGDVFDFIMRINGLRFPEALAALAARAGIELASRDLTPEQKRRVAERDSLFAVNDLARDYFVESLQSPQAGSARKYLDKRQMPQAILESFMLGYAPGGWNGLLNHLKKKNTPPARAEKAGLLARKEGGNPYDRFRGRIIFPIQDIHGRICGFGGRVMDDSLPKYLNSPQTPIYDKKRMLYGLHQARQSCRKTGAAFIVEGYFDVLALAAHGIENCVATCGTALSPEHVRTLKGYAKNIFLVFDSDAAGINAARRSLPLFEAEKVRARVLVLPTGHDPDSFVREQGAQRFQELADNSLDVVPFLIESAIASHGLSLEGKAKVVAEVKEQLAAVSDSVTRSLYIRDLAHRLGVDETAVLDAVREASRTRPRRLLAGGEPPVQALGPEPDRIEVRIVHNMVHCPQSITAVAETRLLRHFQSARLKALGLRLVEYAQGGGDLGGQDVMRLALDPEDRAMLAGILAAEEPVEFGACLGVINQFQQNIARKSFADMNRKIQQAQAEGREDVVFRLLAEKNELQKAQAQKTLSLRVGME